MKINFSKQNMYLLAICTLLLIIILFFSFAVLIPKGKEYRVKRDELKKDNLELKHLANILIEKEERVQKLQSDNLRVIKALDKEFNIDEFIQQYGNFFSSLHITQKSKLENEDGFSVYEVNATSEISSPKSFYNFLDALNKSNWIVEVNFPIDFKRDSEMINSNFSMKVYKKSKNLNGN
ncbi:MAG: hypothetical protein C0628_05585 [Sulfurimonas sp.]|nr:MAG: hypothetical protein C0628_05585 [Sulfurimonas sp.]